MPENATREPIAVIGMACNFPGAANLDAFWQLLMDGGNAVTEGFAGPGEGRMGQIFRDGPVDNEACRYGAFVDDIDQFDAGFFRISPVEADLLDPQQRMMLEASWLALEDAGIDPTRLKGSKTGVYSGISNDEYRMLVLDSTRPSEAAGSLYALSGTNLNGTAGRVSFVLGLNGPAKAVDAACASALVAVHDAVSDLQHGKADLALAGGVQAILNGRIYELRAEAMMLSPEGQCKTFDASADGYVRGEGCGVVVLKRLSDANADGDRIWAVIRGSAVNHGGASAGLTVPHAPAMEKLIQTAHSDAGIPPSEVDYLEAHGTGTAVGDPIEVEAVANVYGEGRESDRPLLMGSVKTNVGHLESAAGIAGLIKAVMAVERGFIPKHLHFNDPNPRLDWDSLPLQVTTENMDWPRRNGRPRLAGVNSFGISGTNAHIVLESYSGSTDETVYENGLAGSAKTIPVSIPESVAEVAKSKDATSNRQDRFLPLSGKSEGAVRDLAKRYTAWLDEKSSEDHSGDVTDALLSDMAWTAAVGRTHFERRSGVLFRDADSLKDCLSELAETAPISEPVSRTNIAFLYTGQGSQWLGMGRALYDSEPVVRAVMDRCEKVFKEERGESLLDVMWGRNGAEGDLSDTAWEQPALYALGCALTALWESVGIRPNIVLGHSVGEIAAAHTAGVFSLEDGMRFAAVRGTLLSATETGTMAAVFAPAAEVESTIEQLNADSAGVGLSIAGYNGAHQVVSGPVVDIEGIVEHSEAQGIRARRLNTSKAFHSALVEPSLDALESFLEGVSIGSPSVTFVSNLTGKAVDSGMNLDGAYWRRHAREAVAFASGVKTMAELGVDLVVEIGPHSVLGPMATLCWPESVAGSNVSEAPESIASLRRPPRDGSSSDAETSFVDAVADAYKAGLDISFEGLFAGESRRKISLPTYPFQRERHWVEQGKQRRAVSGHPLLGVRHEGARGEISYETEVLPLDPVWLNDHRVFGRIVAPGALYGAMAVTASSAEGGGLVLEDMQLHNPLVFSERASDGDSDEEGRAVQVVLDESEQSSSRSVQVFSKSSDGDWTMHIEGRVSTVATPSEVGERIDLESLKSRLSPSDVSDYYRAKLDTGIDLGPLFRTLDRAWVGEGEALGEVVLPELLGRNELDVHPLLLDGCFQVVGVARNMSGAVDEPTYLPFGWERMWLTKRLPDRLICHVRMSESTQSVEHPEVLSGELRIYDLSGELIGGFSGYTVKRATPEALLSAVEEVDDLLYQVVWRDRALEPGIVPADFFPNPSDVAAGSGLFSDYLTEAEVDPISRNALLTDMERWSRSYALLTLEKLGWQRRSGDLINAEELRESLGVLEEHKRLFRRLLEMLAASGVLDERNDGFTVLLGPDDPLPEELPATPEAFHTQMSETYSHGQTEVGLFRRSGAALADVLHGQADPLTLLFSSGEPTAADLYLKAPVAKAANQMLAEAVRKLVAELPEGRRLRVLEVGAGTGSATASVLPELPAGQFDYTYTDISAGFFAEAEARFGDGDGCIEYRPLDIEKDPIAQGFASHGYDLLIASNVLHATRYLEETLGHCLALIAPSGHLVALENLRGLGWMDLTFGQLDGWWRFADEYRPHHALAGPSVWKRALSDAGFADSEVLGVDDSFTHEMLDKGVIVAQGPERVTEPAGVWILAADHGGVAEQLAEKLSERNQTVVVARSEGHQNGRYTPANPAVTETVIDAGSRDSWRSLIDDLPQGIPLSGVVHLNALDGHGNHATTEEITGDVKHAGKSALALAQALVESNSIPAKGMWFMTRGAQVLERESSGELAGSILWGLGKVLALEASHLRPKMIDLDPNSIGDSTEIVNELLFPDEENHIAYRSRQRYAARLVRHEEGDAHLNLPEGADWVLAPDPDGDFYRPAIKQLPPRLLEPREVRVAVEATGLNFWDVFRSMGFIEEGDLGRELCGHVVDVGSDVSSMAVGDRVVGLGFGAFAPEMITHEALIAPAPEGISVSSLATIPSAYVSAALSYRYSGLETGDRVLIHAGAGGVGIAAIQLAQAAGAEVFATASAPKRDFLRSMGVKHIFDSRTTDFGNEILEVTGGGGIDVVLNSLTSEGFIDASLSCLAHGGRFVELARRDILTEAEMAALRPDVDYAILELDVLKKTEPELVGEVLREVMEQISNREVAPIVHSRWPLAEAGTALGFMRSARHIGKIVLTPQPLAKGGLRQDRTYLVTGGLGGIGLAVADWLADHGAGTIVLNGRRDPDSEAEDAIKTLRSRGVNVEVELADVTDTSAIDAMLTRIDANMPPLGGVIHSVGVLSDAALTNQTWASFEQVLWPKIVGAWHLHKATLDRDLDLFILFSSRVGVMGNPGQSNHAAANAFLDQLAGHRRALGLPGQSIAWGAWSEIGEAAEQRERIESRRAALGGRWFTPQQGIRALEQLVKEDTTTSVVMSMDWSVFEEAVTEPPALVEELISSTSSDSKAADASSEALMSQLRGAQASEHEDVLVSFVQRELQAVLRLSSSPSPTVGFFDLGMDSLMAVELRNRLNRAFDGEYVASNTIVFDYPNVSEMARHLSEELGDIGKEKQVFSIAVASTPEPSEPTVDSQRNEDGIAIVGMAGRFPSADNLSQFWEMLESGTDAITDGRQDTGSWEGAVGDPDADDIAYRRGAFLSDIDLFDSRFFRISPIEARMMDPCQRMLLETSWEALEDAGIDPAGLRGSRTGVYAGVGHSEYRDLIEASGRADSYLGTTGSVTVGRVAFALGLEGPALPVDAACASSLASVHQAVVGLQHGEVDMALAGGVNLALSRPVSRFMMDVGMLSPTGVCCPFDADANGYVRGEACGMIVLKRLSDAEADGDRIWAIIRGSGVNQNGASAGLTVPNGQAQERVMREALVQAGIAPSEVDYLEAHATGSQLGDPIELHAAASVYGEGRDPNQPLLVGSVKSNLGHTEWAAGVTALIKTVLSMKEGVIPKHLHFEDPNPHVEWDELPVRVAAGKTEWPNGTGRAPIAGVNAFGMSGTNAHVLIEGYLEADGSNGLAKLPVGTPRNISVSSNGVPQGIVDDDQVDDKSRAVRLLPLSGRSAEALHDLAIRYVELLEGQNEVVSDGWLSDLAWTAGVGRSHFEHRAGVVFDDVKSLLRGLNHVVDNSVADDETPEHMARRVASIYLGDGVRRLDIAKALYETEPAVRSVFDQCELIYRELRGDPLLDLLGDESFNVTNDPAIVAPVAYAFDCALTALWSSVGVNPRIVFGSGLGEVSAAQAAGMFDFEDGLRLSAALGTLAAARAGVESFEGASEALNTVLSQIAWSEPTTPLFSASTGTEIGGEDLMDARHWSNQPDQVLASDAIQRELTSAQVDLVLQFAQEIDTRMHSDWPSVIGAVDGSVDNKDEPRLNGAFVSAIAKAYESGLELTWEGLFAGEQRRRVGLPTYPFQRRRHWF